MTREKSVVRSYLKELISLVFKMYGFESFFVFGYSKCMGFGIFFCFRFRPLVSDIWVVVLHRSLSVMSNTYGKKTFKNYKLVSDDLGVTLRRTLKHLRTLKHSGLNRSCSVIQRVWVLNLF